MNKCSGTDRANRAAEPDFFQCASDQMSALYDTLNQINDPTLNEAWDFLEDAINTAERNAKRYLE